MNLEGKKYIFFDLDNTLTPSRQSIKSGMAEILPRLNRTIIVVSGSKNQQLRLQVGDLKFFSLGQNGNQAFDEEIKLLWENALSLSEKRIIHGHIDLLRPNLTHHIPDDQDLIEDRGSQISFSIYGHHASPEEKKACDGDFNKRRRLLAEYPLEHDEIEVQMGGSTCLDYFKKGSNKGSNIRRLIETHGWSPIDCVYFGDALFPGGNDESVIGVIDTVAVKDEDDTEYRLRSFAR